MGLECCGFPARRLYWSVMKYSKISITNVFSFFMCQWWVPYTLICSMQVVCLLVFPALCPYIPKKGDTKLTAVTQSNLNWSSKFFHWSHLTCVATLPCKIFFVENLLYSRLKCSKPPHKTQLLSQSKILVQWFHHHFTHWHKYMYTATNNSCNDRLYAFSTIKKKDIVDLCSKTPLLSNSVQLFAYGGR